MTSAADVAEEPEPEPELVPDRALVRLAGAGTPAWLARVGRFGQRVLELFPWTPLGLGLAVASYGALRALAYAQLDLVWFVTGAAALGLCALAPLFVIGGAIHLRLAVRKLPPADALTLETGVSSSTGFSLPSLRFLPFTQVRWQWLSPSDARITLEPQGGLLREQVVLAERGRHTQIERRVSVEDPFGLSRVSFRLRSACAIRVLPRLDGLSHLPSLVSLSAGAELPHPMGLEDGDRLELQRYAPGDPARFIHWKVFARTRRLMVRKPERAVAIARRSAAFYLAGPDDDATAAVARLAISRELLGREWVFGTDRDAAGSSQIEPALGSLIESVGSRDGAGRGLSAFLAEVEKRGPASVIVFAPSEPGPWIELVSSVARRRQLRVVIGVDGVATRTPAPLWSRLLTSAVSTSGASASALEGVLGALARAGVAVSLLDRKTGRLLGEQERRALLSAARFSGRRPALRGAA